MVVVCAGCEGPILDRFLLNVLDRAWHAKCVQCADCKDSLTEKCFSRDGKLYCRGDFFRRFGTKCAGCSQGISPNDLVRRARNKVFHLKCFTCMVCRKQLSTGEELYVLDENKFICKEDYLSSKFHGSDGEDGDDLMDSHLMDKLDDGMSDKTSSIHDDDSHDASLPAGHHLHAALPHPHPHHYDSPLLGSAALTPVPTAAPGGPGIPHLHPGSGAATPGVLNDSGCSTSTPVSPAHSDCPHGGKDDANNNDAHTDNSDVSNNNTSTSSLGGDQGLSDTSSNKENSDKADGSVSIKCEGGKDGKDGEGGTTGTKRRGPRTTIKAKQLETLKAAFAATPKPTRHIREQLAQETGLNMRVIQVWFQNRRSKERRMKQLSALGARRQFFRNPRTRMRGLRPGEELGDADMMGQPGFNYFGDNGEFYPGYPGYPGDYFPGQQDPTGNLAFLPPTAGPQGTPPLVDQPVPPSGMVPEFLHGEMVHMPPNSSPEPNNMGPHDGGFGAAGVLPPRSMAGFPPSLQMAHQVHQEMETW